MARCGDIHYGCGPVHVVRVFASHQRAKPLSCKVTRLASLRRSTPIGTNPRGTTSSRIDRHPWAISPNILPKAEVKIAYDESALYVIFRVEDHYVCAVTPKYQGSFA